MVKTGASRVVMIGAYAIMPGYLVWLFLAVVFLVVGNIAEAGGDPDWLDVMFAAELVLLQALAVIACTGLYWAPRFFRLAGDTSARQPPTNMTGLLLISSIPVLAYLGMTTRGSAEFTDGLPLLTISCLVVIVPAMLDVLARRALSGERAAPRA